MLGSQWNQGEDAADSETVDSVAREKYAQSDDSQSTESFTHKAAPTPEF